VSLLDQELPGGQQRHERARCVHVVDPAGLDGKLGRRHADVLSVRATVGAGESHHRVDLVAGREAGHVSSDVLDNAGDIGSENQGEVHLWPPLGREHLHALAQVPVGRIESDSMDSHDDLAWAGNGLRCIFVSQNIRATELVQPDRFHLLVSFGGSFHMFVCFVGFYS